MPKIALWTLGGTIAMQKADRSDLSPRQGVTPSLAGQNLLSFLGDAVPDDCTLVTEALSNVGSANISIPLLLSLANKALSCDQDALIVTQGTDTLEDTSFLLSLLIGDRKPIVFTGAMKASSALSADGPANLADALTLALDLTRKRSGDRQSALLSKTCKDSKKAAHSLNGGVYVVIHSEIHDPFRLRKSHTSLLSAFESDGGPIGVFSEGHYYLNGQPAVQTRDFLRKGLDIAAFDAALPKVRLITAALDDDPDWIKSVVAGCDGLVVEGVGAGHVSEVWSDRLADIAAEIPVVIASRAGRGCIFTSTYGYKGAEIDLLSRGIVPAGRLTAHKARLALMIALAAGEKTKTYKAQSKQPAGWREIFETISDF